MKHMKLKKIVSGGQTGADQGGLVAAHQRGIATGGWVPKGWRTESGPCPALGSVYHLREHSSSAYPPRTAANVRDSDGTAWFGSVNSAGFRCTKWAADELQKPFRVIKTADELCAFVDEHHIEVLNVAGNRESKRPGIHRFTAELITHALEGRS